MTPKKGLLVAVEGIDAVGKRTQSSILEAWLRSRGLATGAMSFPDYETAIGREIRKFLMGERAYPHEVRHILFAANRWEKKAALEGLLSSCDMVIVNRYSESNLAYGTANGLPMDWLAGLESGLPKSDLVVVLDAPPKDLFRRRALNKDRNESNRGLQEGAREAYLKLAKDLGWKVVDAGQGIEPTGQAVSSAVSQLLAASGRTV
ncbi:MAG: dTMP kinase [archaeon]|nr:MAG: dTMP kinase [archaeon]